MNTNPITPKDVLQEMVSIAQDNPDFVYIDQGATTNGFIKDCSYLGRAVGDPTGSACIVGRALSNLGVSDETLRSCETVPASGVIPAVTVPSNGDDDFSITMTIDQIQECQDCGDSWGKAIDNHRDRIHSYGIVNI